MSYDTDAQTYITAVETADGESLETGVKDAINAFVVGCKADGIWTAIKASCILAGARTLTGALVPLVGTAPTNNNFVSGDFGRILGLTGNGINKYLQSGRNGSDDPQDDIHRSVYLTANRNILNGRYISGATQYDSVLGEVTGFRARVNSNSIYTLGNGTTVPSLIGVSRASSSDYTWRGLGQDGTQANVSSIQDTGEICVFAARGPSAFIDSTLAFYSIGESLDLALLDARVTTLITDIGTALA